MAGCNLIGVLSSRLLLVFIAASTLAACASGVQPAIVTASYDTSILQYIDSRGGLPTDVTGNPFSAPDEQVHTVVRETMARSHFGPKFPFLAEKPQGFGSAYRMVVVLNPAPGTAYHKVCTGPATAQTDKPAGGEVRVAAALCAKDRMITSTEGRVAGASGPDDPAFIAVIAQISHALFPLRDEKDQDRMDLFPF